MKITHIDNQLLSDDIRPLYESVSSENTHIVKGVGESMKGIYSNNDILMVDMDDTQYADVGTYMITHNNEHLCKLVSRRGGVYYYYSANRDLDPIITEVKKGDSFSINGKVVGVLKLLN